MKIEKSEIRIRIKGEENNKDLVLAKYLNSEKTPYKTKEMVMMALSAYWLPFAYKDKFGTVDRECILSCLYLLNLQRDYLLQMLGRESNGDVMESVSENIQQEKVTPISENIQQEIKNELDILEKPKEDWFSPF